MLHKSKGRPGDWARQMLLQVKRWLPHREVIAVGDSSYAVIDLLAAVRQQLTMITRLRLDAALYAPAPPRQPGKPGRNRKKGKRLPTLKKVLEHPATKWRKIVLSQWYGYTDKVIEITTATAVWYHSGGRPAENR
uniref:Transposase n=1 Tax=Roseihalotalea indica TaxID=2867963 RepID=A0AA49GHN5_9BACT|nr:transposase [Tunicatimonas sp. TK19036]